MEVLSEAAVLADPALHAAASEACLTVNEVRSLLCISLQMIAAGAQTGV